MADLSTVWITTLVLVILRMASMVFAAPVLGSVAVPGKIRFGVSLALSLAIVSRMAHPVALPTSAGDLMLIAGGEILIGVTMGLAARLLFVGVQMGAFHAAQQMGLALAEVYNPQQEEVGGPVRALLTIVTIVIFLSIGGHRQLISAAISSFETIPPAICSQLGSLLAMSGLLVTSCFALALKVAGPVLVTMLLATVAMGFLQKSMPQFNLLTTHLPARAMLGLLALAGSVAVIQPLAVGFAEYLLQLIAALA